MISLKNLKKSLKTEIFLTGLIDIVFLLSTYFTLFFFSSNLNSYLKKVENIAQISTPGNISSASLLVSAMQEVMFRTIIYVVIVLILVFIYYIGAKGLIYRITTKRKFKIKKFTYFSLIWMAILLIPILFSFFFIVTFSLLDLISIPLIISGFILIYFLYTMMLSNLLFFKEAKYSKIKQAFSLSYRKLLPLGLFVIIFLLINLSWSGIAYLAKIGEDAYFISLGLIFMLLISWFRNYMHLELK